MKYSKHYYFPVIEQLSLLLSMRNEVTKLHLNLKSELFSRISLSRI